MRTVKGRKDSRIRSGNPGNRETGKRINTPSTRRSGAGLSCTTRNLCSSILWPQFRGVFDEEGYPGGYVRIDPGDGCRLRRRQQHQRHQGITRQVLRLLGMAKNFEAGCSLRRAASLAAFSYTLRNTDWRGAAVNRRRWLTLLCGFMLLGLVPGCGGCGVSGRGKNSDLDRPKQEKK